MKTGRQVQHRRAWYFNWNSCWPFCTAPSNCVRILCQGLTRTITSIKRGFDGGLGVLDNECKEQYIFGGVFIQPSPVMFRRAMKVKTITLKLIQFHFSSSFFIHFLTGRDKQQGDRVIDSPGRTRHKNTYTCDSGSVQRTESYMPRLAVYYYSASSLINYITGV